MIFYYFFRILSLELLSSDATAVVVMFHVMDVINQLQRIQYTRFYMLLNLKLKEKEIETEKKVVSQEFDTLMYFANFY